MEKVFLTDGPDFTVAEKSSKTEWAELLLHQFGVVIRMPKKILAASVAAAKAAAVNGRAGELVFGAREQVVHVFGCRRRVTPLELHGLSRARHGADGQHAGIQVATDEIAHEKIATVKIFEIFVDDEADEKIATRLLLFGGWKFLERFRKHGVGGAVGDLLDGVVFDPGQCPGLADGRATL